MDSKLYNRLFRKLKKPYRTNYRLLKWVEGVWLWAVEQFDGEVAEPKIDLRRLPKSEEFKRNISRILTGKKYNTKAKKQQSIECEKAYQAEYYRKNRGAKVIRQPKDR